MSSQGVPPTRVYEDFVPTTELVQEPDVDTLLLDLTGFKKEQVKVQLTRTGILKISGERPVAGQNKWLRFQKDFPLSQNCDRTKISAKFENGILYVKQPKLITSSEKKGQESSPSDAEHPNKPANDPQPLTKGQESSPSDAQQPKKPLDEPQPLTKGQESSPSDAQHPKIPANKPQPLNEGQELSPSDAQQPKKPVDEPQPQKKDDERTKGEKTPTPTEALPKQQTNANKPQKEENIPAEKTGENSTVEDVSRPSYESELENDANTRSVTAPAEKLKMPRNVMNMTLIALLVLGIGLYISNMMKSNNYKAKE